MIPGPKPKFKRNLKIVKTYRKGKLSLSELGAMQDPPISKVAVFKIIKSTEKRLSTV